tara:strand:+ start:2925 stop:3128 length:204 start_codon:yes stop_codon:yes gene_type:complete
MSNKKENKNDSIKKEDIKTQLEGLVNKYNESQQLVETNTEIMKRCLGAIEVLQNMIKEEEPENKEEK